MAIVSFGGKDMNPIADNNRKKNKKESFYDLPLNLYQKEYISPAIKCNIERSTFLEAMKLSILIGQCFGLNPVQGITKKDPSKLRFSFLSAKSIYTYVSILGQMCMIFLCIMKLATQTESNFYSNTLISFYAVNSFTCIVFLRIATKWPQLCQLIAKAEAEDPNLDMRLVKKCNLTCVLILVLGLVEHTLSDLTALSVALDCQPDVGWFEAYLRQINSLLWTFFDYNIVLGIVAQVIAIQCTFNWNFADAFIICISHYLISRLEKINNRILIVRGKKVPSAFWRSVREDYTRTCNIVRKVDNVISGIIFISFANNMFIICMQLLHLLEEGVRRSSACDKAPNERAFLGLDHPINFLYSLGILLVRSLSVALIGSRVYTASREPIFTLYEVPSASYCIEVQRFLDQIHADPVALTGLQFFDVKRGLVLTIAGTIVTYELVLMQFTGISATPVAS